MQFRDIPIGARFRVDNQGFRKLDDSTARTKCGRNLGFLPSEEVDYFPRSFGTIRSLSRKIRETETAKREIFGAAQGGRFSSETASLLFRTAERLKNLNQDRVLILRNAIEEATAVLAETEKLEIC